MIGGYDGWGTVGMPNAVSSAGQRTIAAVPAPRGATPARREPPPQLSSPVPAHAWTEKVFEFKGWNRWSDKKRVKVLRRMAEDYGRDPELAELAVRIVESSAAPRDYPGQAAALLAWVQQAIYYVNEPDERIQTPKRTLEAGKGDCDDMAILLAALCESIALPWRYVLGGVKKRTGERTRWIEGNRMPRGATWIHIYLCIGWPPFSPKEWAVAEPTVRGAPLGTDLALEGGGGAATMPEYSGWNALGGVPGLGDSEAVEIVTAEASPTPAPTPSVEEVSPVTVVKAPSPLRTLLDFIKEIDWRSVGMGVVEALLTAVVLQKVLKQ